MSKARTKRKKEHLLLALRGARCSFVNWFADITLPHDSLTTVDYRDTDLTSCFAGHQVPIPIYINAITGGTLAAEAINRHLARAAARFSLPMAVGSQRAAIDNTSLAFTFSVVPKYHPNGLLVANVSASAPPRRALAAVAMLEAQALQLHLNPVQEYVMPEGDRPHPALLDNIADICSRSPVPVIVKEVGFGIGAQQARRLAAVGVKAIDVSGRGGTNFAAIEGARTKANWWRPLARWGYPTPLCVAELAQLPDLEVMAAGGIDDGIKILKSLALGASSAGLAGAVLQVLVRTGFGGLCTYLDGVIRQLRIGLALTGNSRVAQLATTPVYVGGRLAELMQLKGIDLQRLAKRS